MHAFLFFEERMGLKVNGILQWPLAIFHFDVFEIWKCLPLDAILELQCTTMPCLSQEGS